MVRVRAHSVVEISRANDGQVPAPPPRQRSRFLVRHIMLSDTHEFVGRVFDLSVVSLHFESYKALSAHDDCKYVHDTNYFLSKLVRRVETLNLAGDMLWPKPYPSDFKHFPIDRYQWLTISADVFLMRYISVVDCALILTASVYETGLDAKDASFRNLAKRGVAANALVVLEAMLKDQGALRPERNARFHHGSERRFTEHDEMFRSLARWDHPTGNAIGTDQFGRKVRSPQLFKEGLTELQREFNASTRLLSSGLTKLYDVLAVEFETRFEPKIAAATHGLNCRPVVRRR